MVDLVSFKKSVNQEEAERVYKRLVLRFGESKLLTLKNVFTALFNYSLSVKKYKYVDIPLVHYSSEADRQRIISMKSEFDGTDSMQRKKQIMREWMELAEKNGLMYLIAHWYVDKFHNKSKVMKQAYGRVRDFTFVPNDRDEEKVHVVKSLGRPVCSRPGCDKAAHFKCTQCFTKFCSVECQTEEWKSEKSVHAQICRLISVPSYADNYLIKKKVVYTDNNRFTELLEQLFTDDGFNQRIMRIADLSKEKVETCSHYYESIFPIPVEFFYDAIQSHKRGLMDNLDDLKRRYHAEFIPCPDDPITREIERALGKTGMKLVKFKESK